MTDFYKNIIAYIKENNKNNTELLQLLNNKSDDELLKLIFSNHRGLDGSERGLKLTNYGYEILKNYFQTYEIKRKKNSKITIEQVLFLDKYCTLPYYYDINSFIFFEKKLAVNFKLADNDLDILMKMTKE